MNNSAASPSVGAARTATAILLSLAPFAVAACHQDVGSQPAAREAAAPIGPVSVGEEVASFYRERGFKPLWLAGRTVKPEALALVRSIEQAALHGLDPALYQPARLRRAITRSGKDPQSLASTELLLSRAYTDFVRDLGRQPERSSMIYVDEELRPAPLPARALLARLADAESFQSQVEADLRLNPLYDRLVTGFARYFERWSGLPQRAVPAGPDMAPGASGERVRLLRMRLGLKAGAGSYDDALAKAVRRFEAVHGLVPDGIADAGTIAALNRGYRHYERIIQANLERARALPAGTSGRFVLVDTAGARLWLFEDGRVYGTMRTIVGKPGMETPEMAGLIRFAVLNPYWNVPPDLIRHNVAKRVLREGVGLIGRQRLQVLSDWTPGARILTPTSVNWRAVAAGRQLVQVRQLPGASNMMGEVKFMMPNKLGVYLHDTPDKSSFGQDDRRISSGCVRVEDARRLSDWLFRGAPVANSGAPEQRVNLPEPVPVYITYLTAVPGPGGIVFQKDVYGRDQATAL